MKLQIISIFYSKMSPRVAHVIYHNTYTHPHIYIPNDCGQKGLSLV